MRKEKFNYLIVFLSGIISLCITFGYEKKWLGSIGVPLDDSYIHLHYAKNILKGEWFAYNLGEPSSGDTSPLWVIILSGFGIFSKDFVLLSVFLSGLFYILSGILSYLLGKEFFKDNRTALAFSLLVIFTGRFLWLGASGMEGTLFSFLNFAGLLSYLEDKKRSMISPATSALFGLSANARPEGYLLFIFVLLDWFLFEKIKNWRSFSLKDIPFMSGMVYLAFALPYPLFSWFTTSHLVPNTFRAIKSAFYFSRDEYLRLVLEFFYHDNLLLHIALPFGTILFLYRAFRSQEGERTFFLLWLWPLGYLFLSFLLTPVKYHFQRYLIPQLPFFILLSLYGWDLFFNYFEEKRESIRILRQCSLIILCLWAIFITLFFWPKITAQCVKNIKEMQEKIGRWVKDNTEEDALIAANDIGAIFYISQRRVIDLVGLVNPELVDRVRGNKIQTRERDLITLDYLLQKKPDFLIIFPYWFPTLPEKKQYFQKVYWAEIKDNLICAGDEMVVYKCFFSESQERN